MEAKERAARSAVSRIKTGQILGLGTGSTVQYALEALARRIRDENLQVLGVPTSMQTQRECERLGIPLTTLVQHPVLDLAFDGADQVDDDLQCIKGYGGALLREKIVASATRCFLVMVDEGKVSPRLNKPIPVEVLPFGVPVARGFLEKIGHPVLRQPGKKPYETDNGNQVFDVDLGEVSDARELAIELDAIPGVVGHGLFIDLTTELHVGSANDVRVVLSHPPVE
jgi:ribose 5-phosphate isomerase A